MSSNTAADKRVQVGECTSGTGSSPHNRNGFTCSRPSLPCLVCSDTSGKCSRHLQKPLVLCRVKDANHRGAEKRHDRRGKAYWVHCFSPSSILPVPTVPTDADEPRDLHPIASDLESNLTPELAAELIAHLNLPPGAKDLLALIGVGFRHGSLKKNRRRGRWRTRDGWTFRERDGCGRTIGLHVRFRDGMKRQHDASKRGLCVPAGILKVAAKVGYILLVEGASDVLALLAAGIPAIGRPGCNAGVGHLATLLADLPHEVQVIVVGENDYKLLSGRWPGRTGAHFTAAKLARLLNRSIAWAVVPGRYKERGFITPYTVVSRIL
jgi:hypothetical protein